MDEPFSSQDVEAQVENSKVINKLKSELDLTIICVSHDLNILKNFSDDLIIMYNGKIVESGLYRDFNCNPTK